MEIIKFAELSEKYFRVNTPEASLDMIESCIKELSDQVEARALNANEYSALSEWIGNLQKIRDERIKQMKMQKAEAIEQNAKIFFEKGNYREAIVLYRELIEITGNERFYSSIEQAEGYLNGKYPPANLPIEISRSYERFKKMVDERQYNLAKEQEDALFQALHNGEIESWAGLNELSQKLQDAIKAEKLYKSAESEFSLGMFDSAEDAIKKAKWLDKDPKFGALLERIQSAALHLNSARMAFRFKKYLEASNEIAALDENILIDTKFRQAVFLGKLIYDSSRAMEAEEPSNLLRLKEELKTSISLLENNETYLELINDGLETSEKLDKQIELLKAADRIQEYLFEDNIKTAREELSKLAMADIIISPVMKKKIQDLRNQINYKERCQKLFQQIENCLISGKLDDADSLLLLLSEYGCSDFTEVGELRSRAKILREENRVHRLTAHLNKLLSDAHKRYGERYFEGAQEFLGQIEEQLKELSPDQQLQWKIQNDYLSLPGEIKQSAEAYRKLIDAKMILQDPQKNSKMESINEANLLLQRVLEISSQNKQIVAIQKDAKKLQKKSILDSLIVKRNWSEIQSQILKDADNISYPEILVFEDMGKSAKRNRFWVNFWASLTGISLMVVLVVVIISIVNQSTVDILSAVVSACVTLVSALFFNRSNDANKRAQEALFEQWKNLQSLTNEK